MVYICEIPDPCRSLEMLRDVFFQVPSKPLWVRRCVLSQACTSRRGLSLKLECLLQPHTPDSLIPLLEAGNIHKNKKKTLSSGSIAGSWALQILTCTRIPWYLVKMQTLMQSFWGRDLRMSF